MKRATAPRRALTCTALLLAGLLATAASAAGPPDETCDPNDPRTFGVTEDTPVEDQLLLLAFPCVFEPLSSEPAYRWVADLNQDGQDDVIVRAISKIRVGNAWRHLPISNPPYELSSIGEVLENPMFVPQYSIRPGERYLVVFHGRAPGWKQKSIDTAFILQDVAETAPELTEFGSEDERIPALAIRYQDRPGLLYWEAGRYVVALKESN